MDQKLWEISRKMYVEKVAFNIILRLHSTAYSRTKNFTTNTFLELLKKKKIF